MSQIRILQISVSRVRIYQVVRITIISISQVCISLLSSSPVGISQVSVSNYRVRIYQVSISYLLPTLWYRHHSNAIVNYPTPNQPSFRPTNHHIHHSHPSIIDFSIRLSYSMWALINSLKTQSCIDIKNMEALAPVNTCSRFLLLSRLCRPCTQTRPLRYIFSLMETLSFVWNKGWNFRECFGMMSHTRRRVFVWCIAIFQSRNVFKQMRIYDGAMKVFYCFGHD